jgi:subtilisin family serine protease
MAEACTWGTSFSALHAVGAAVLVWSVLPELGPAEVRALLLEAARPVAGAKGPRALAIADAVALARRRVVERTLGAGPCSLDALSAITGLELHAASATLAGMIAAGVVTRLTSGRLERYQLA